VPKASKSKVEIVRDANGDPVRVRLPDGQERALSVFVEWTRCGSCTTCKADPKAKPHGPYLRGRYTCEGKTRTHHLGRAPDPEMPDPDGSKIGMEAETAARALIRASQTDVNFDAARADVEEIVRKLDAESKRLNRLRLQLSAFLNAPRSILAKMGDE